MEQSNIGKIKKWFKESPWYFWLVLVIPESFKQAIPFTELKGRIVGLIISLIVGFILVVVLRQVGQIPDVGANLYTLAVWLAVTFIWRFLTGLFTISANLYRGMETEANKGKWVDVPISIPSSFQVNPHGACLMITNHKKVKVQKAAVRLMRVIERNRALREDVLENSEIWIPRSKGGVFYPRGTLDEEGTGIYSVAHWNNNEAWINTMDNYSISEKIPLKEDIPYIVMLKFIGYVEGKPMDENQRRYAVRYVNQRVELSELT